VNLTVDIGNSFTKIAFFSSKSKIIKVLRFDNSDENIYKFIEENSFDACILSSVLRNNEKIEGIIKQRTSNFLKFSHKTAIPLKNLYKTPETLGLDRLAAAVGAYSLYPQKNILIFDAGSALTIDFVSENAEYSGGNISPGLSMRFKALNTFTDKLPLCEKKDDFLKFGNDTCSAITAGVLNGMIAEIDAYIDNFNKKYDNLITIITGGDSFFFENKLKNSIFVNPDLIMQGLNNILIFNE